MDRRTALTVLGLSNDEAWASDPVVLKRAYRRALLSAHPDHAAAAAAVVDSNRQTPSVDHVRAAFLLLSSSPSTTKKEEERRPNEAVDLDDFYFAHDEREYVLACRCGHAYRVRETDLAAGMDVVACDGCSLLVQVLYEEEEDEEVEVPADDDIDNVKDEDMAIRNGTTNGETI